MTQWRIVFVLLDGFEAFDLAGPLQVFHEAIETGCSYRVCFTGVEPNLEAAQSLHVSGLQAFPTDVAPSDTVIVPGGTAIRNAVLERNSRILPAVAWIRSAYEAGARVASVCVGAFVLGAAGLLDGRSATTHWRRVDELQRTFPKANVHANRLYVFDGRIATSGGIASGVDLALALLERDAGPRVAATIAREMVLTVRRSGTQEQLSPYLAGRNHVLAQVHAVQDWLAEHAGETFTLESLAAIAGVSPRTLTRQFRAATDQSVKEYANAIRLECARTLLADGTLTIDDVAARCGLADGRHLRRLWRQAYGSSPSQSRASTSH